jgi:hypothetical protein
VEDEKGNAQQNQRVQQAARFRGVKIRTSHTVTVLHLFQGIHGVGSFCYQGTDWC